MVYSPESYCITKRSFSSLTLLVFHVMRSVLQALAIRCQCQECSRSVLSGMRPVRTVPGVAPSPGFTAFVSRDAGAEPRLSIPPKSGIRSNRSLHEGRTCLRPSQVASHKSPVTPHRSLVTMSLFRHIVIPFLYPEKPYLSPYHHMAERYRTIPQVWVYTPGLRVSGFVLQTLT